MIWASNEPPAPRRPRNSASIVGSSNLARLGFSGTERKEISSWLKMAEVYTRIISRDMGEQI